jgi:hypothetical protein
VIFEVQRSSRSEARKEELRKQEFEVILILKPLCLFLWFHEISGVLLIDSHASKGKKIILRSTNFLKCC